MLTQVVVVVYFFFQAEDGIRDLTVTGVQTCALPISPPAARAAGHVDDRVHAGAGWPGRLDRGRREPGDLSPLAPQGGRLAAAGVPVLAADPEALLPADRGPAAAPQHLARAGACRQPLRPRLPRAAGAGEAPAESAGVGTHRERHAPDGRARRARRSLG